MIWKIGVRRDSKIGYDPIEYVIVQSSTLDKAIAKVSEKWQDYKIVSMYEETVIDIINE